MKHKKPENIILFSLAAIVLIGFFLTDLIIKFCRHSDGALEQAQFFVSVVILSGFLLILILLTWRNWRRIKQRNEYFDED